MHFGTKTKSGLNSEGGLKFEWSLYRNFTVVILVHTHTNVEITHKTTNTTSIYYNRITLGPSS